MPSRKPLTHQLTREQREQYIAGYSAMIEENRFGREPHYINFMFHSIPGSTEARLEAMKRDIIRVHDLLMRSTVRKPNSPNWQASRPIFIGCPDLPVIKRKKQHVRNFMVNDGLHFNAISLTPPTRSGTVQPLTHLFLPTSRLKVSLEEHFRRQQQMYQTEHLYRIHVTPIVDGTMADYTLKTFKNGYVTPDEVLVLN
jgi:hypothetical protein